MINVVLVLYFIVSKYGICGSNIKDVITTIINDIFYWMTKYFVALYDNSLIKIDVFCYLVKT